MLSTPARLRILDTLFQNGFQSVSAVVSETPYDQPYVSEQLSRMESENLLRRRKNGQHVEYAIGDPTIEAVCVIVRYALHDRGA